MWRRFCLAHIPTQWRNRRPKDQQQRSRIPASQRNTPARTAGIAGGATPTSTTAGNPPAAKSKKGSRAAPLSVNLLCRLGSAQISRMFHERRAPQERCVQRYCSSKPGGVMSPPKLCELTGCIYSRARGKAREEFTNTKARQRGCWAELWRSGWAYLIKRVSRSWSRLTKDFMVRKRPNRSWISRF